MNVRLPDGTIIQNVPDGTTKADLATKLKANGVNVPDDWMASPKAATPTTSEGFLNGVKEAVSNIPGSAVDVGSNLLQAISHPINTGKGVLDIGAGALQAAFAPESFKTSGNPMLYSPKADQAFRAAVDFYKKRYGSWDNFINTVKKDPVGVAMDVSAVAGGLGSAADAAGLTKTASTLSKVSRATDPVRQATRVAKGVIRPSYEYAVGMTTGSGAEAIKQALKGGDAFTQAMRGKISESDVLDAAKGALQKIKDERGAAYRQKLGELSKNTKALNIDDLKAAADKWLANYGIQKTADGLDFSRSTLRNNVPAANEVKTVYETIEEWGSKPGDTTPLGLDTLKRTISDTYASQNPSRAMVSDLANKVKAKIVREVPEYSTMTKDYASTSKVIKDMEGGLGLSQKANTDTALRKLMTAMREDKTFRRSLMDKLDETAGKDVAGAVAGLVMKNPWSNRLGSSFHSFGTGYGALYFHNPAVLAALPLGSPRFIGELSRLASKTAPLLQNTSPLYQSGFQASRVPGLTDGGLYPPQSE